MIKNIHTQKILEDSTEEVSQKAEKDQEIEKQEKNGELQTKEN